MRPLAFVIGIVTLVLSCAGVVAAIILLRSAPPYFWLSSLLGGLLVACQSLLLIVVVQIADHLIPRQYAHAHTSTTSPVKWRVTGVERSGKERLITIMALNDQEAAQIALDRYAFIQVRSVDRG